MNQLNTSINSTLVHQFSTTHIHYILVHDHIGGVMVSGLASIVVNRVFDS
jgi:hypothetical protein